MAVKKAKKKVLERVTQAEFARRKNVSRSAVNQAIDSKRIKLEDDGKILVEQALIDWDANANVGQQRGKPDEDWNNARTRREIAEANLKELEYEERIGKMVEIEKVRPPLLEMVNMTKQRALKLPRRVATMLEMKETKDIEDILYHELELVFESLVADV